MCLCKFVCMHFSRVCMSYTWGAYLPAPTPSSLHLWQGWGPPGWRKKGGSEARWLAAFPRWVGRWGEIEGDICLQHQESPGRGFHPSTNHFQPAMEQLTAGSHQLAAWNLHGWVGDANAPHRCKQAHTRANKHVITQSQRHTQTNTSSEECPRSRTVRSGMAGS